MKTDWEWRHKKPNAGCSIDLSTLKIELSRRAIAHIKREILVKVARVCTVWGSRLTHDILLKNRVKGVKKVRRKERSEIFTCGRKGEIIEHKNETGRLKFGLQISAFRHCENFLTNSRQFKKNRATQEWKVARHCSVYRTRSSIERKRSNWISCSLRERFRRRYARTNKYTLSRKFLESY